jgi:pimeloyl-ACP methyl ester carboxylesterase
MKKSPVFLQVSLIVLLLFSSTAAALLPVAQASQPIQNNLLDLPSGEPCPNDSFFTCITIEVPLDHFNLDDTRTIPVVFAVLPASGERKGMFVVATGGPGTSGVLLADYYSSTYDTSIFESFDIVFFDQRGIGLSGGLTCPLAANEYYQSDGRGLTRKQENALKKAARTFAEDCVEELTNPALLPYLGTRQAVEDLEYFRQLVGDEKFWLYGESYGTQFSQTYAAAHPEHLAGLILDAPVDLTFSGMEFYAQQAQAFNDTLIATLSACNADQACAEDMNGDAVQAYDSLAMKLSKQPISFKFPLPTGKLVNRKFTFSNLEFVAASQMYAESDRMMFNRALAAYASNGDIVPLARLLYLGLGVDPPTLEVISDPSWSDAIFYGVECQDYGYPGTTPQEKAENYLDAADAVEASVPRLASVIYGDLPCAHWPAATSDLTRPDYLVAEDTPTLVLGATADPATPISHAINIYQHLADGYLITQEGGPHVIFAWGNECPDALVTDFLVNDVVPTQRETVCEGYVADDYVPVAPGTAREIESPAEALSSVEAEISYLPEYFYWDGFEATSAGCTYGGVLSFEYNWAGTRSLFTLQNCAFTRNFVMTGTGSYNFDTDRFVLEVRTEGRWKCDLKYVRNGDRVRVTGKCNGQPIDRENSSDRNLRHISPEFDRPNVNP